MLSFTKKANQNHLPAPVTAINYGLPPLVINQEELRQQFDRQQWERIQLLPQQQLNHRTLEQVLNDYPYPLYVNDMYGRYRPRP